jgi:hypothetical protein
LDKDILTEITYYPIYGKPFILYLGILTLTSFLITTTIGISIHKEWAKIKFRWHPTMAGISIPLAIIHGILGTLAYF